MTPAIKICGICNLADAQLAVDHGAQYLGLIFAQSSPRYIDPIQARSIVEAIVGAGDVGASDVGAGVSPPVSSPVSLLASERRLPKIVGAFQNATEREIESIADSVGLDYIQLHGHESPTVCASLSRPVIKAFQIGTLSQAANEQPCLTLSFRNTALNDYQLDLDRCLDILDRYRPYCRHFLFDKPKNVANAHWLDFATNQLKLIEDQLGEYFLAGGLNAGNVKAALQTLTPAVVDIASGVEQTAREKNRKLMTDFFAALGIQY